MNYTEFEKEFNDQEFKKFLKKRIPEEIMIRLTTEYLLFMALTFNAGRKAGREGSDVSHSEI